jgi:Mg2+ and Co2+ transporter CorA
MSQHEETKEIVDSFLADLIAMGIQMTLVRHQMTSAETQLSLLLDMVQNRVLQMTTILSLIALNFSFATYITNVFGMNLDFDGSHDSGVFASVFVISFVLSFVGILMMYYYFKFTGAIQTESKTLERKYLQ